MYENSEELTAENTSSMQTKSSDLDIAVVEAQTLEISDDTQNLQSIQPKKVSTVAETPPPVPATPAKQDTSNLQSVQPKKVPTVAETRLPMPATPTKKAPKKNLPVKVNKQDVASTRLLQEQCRQLCLQLFFREDNSVRSLGFTSSIGGEGKSLLALATAKVLAHDGNDPVTLVECNWEHPTLHECFDLPATPGLAEWLRGTCDENDIRYQVEDNLTVIPAGNGTQDAVKLLKQAQQHGLLKTIGY